MIWSVPFWKATAERVLSTFLFAFLAAAGLGGAPTTMEAVPWLAAVNIGAAAAVGSLVKCMLVALPDGNPGAGSFEAIAQPGATAHPAGADPVVVESGDDYDPKRIEGR